jgi:hypothetical protein
VLCSIEGFHDERNPNLDTMRPMMPSTLVTMRQEGTTTHHGRHERVVIVPMLWVRPSFTVRHPRAADEQQETSHEIRNIRLFSLPSPRRRATMQSCVCDKVPVRCRDDAGPEMNGLEESRNGRHRLALGETESRPSSYDPGLVPYLPCIWNRWLALIRTRPAAPAMEES